MDELTEEEVENIRELYADLGNVQKVAEELGYSSRTVAKYTEDMRDGDDGPPEGWTAVPPEGTASAPDAVSGDDSSPDFTTMTYKEFVQWFFKHNGFGVKENFAKNLAQQCQLRQEIPDQQTLRYMLEAHGSGIGNSNDAQMIAESWWAAAQRYLNARGSGGSNQPMPSGTGGWAGRNEQQSDNNPEPGGWMEAPATDGGQEARPQPQPGGWQSPPQRQPSSRRPPAQGYPQQRPPASGQQTDPTMERMMDQMQSQQEKMMEFMEEQQEQMKEFTEDVVEKLGDSGSDSDDSGGFTDNIKEVVQAKQELESLSESDGEMDEATNEAIGILQRQLAQIQESLESDSGGQEVDIAKSSSPLEAAAAKALMDGDMNDDTANRLADILGVNSDPEVRKAEIEKEMEIKKEEMKKERWGELIESVPADEVGETIRDFVSVMNATASESQPQGEQQSESAESASDGESEDIDAGPASMGEFAEQAKADAADAESDGSDVVVEDEVDTEAVEVEAEVEADPEPDAAPEENGASVSDDPDQCQYIKDDGERCQRPAQEGSDFCWEATHTASNNSGSADEQAEEPAEAE